MTTNKNSIKNPLNKTPLMETLPENQESEILHCDPRSIKLYLSGNLAKESMQGIERHLDECESCQQAFQSEAAPSSLWQEAREVLRSAATKHDLSMHGRSNAQHEESKLPSSYLQMALSLLEPSTNPNMMGRFAGYDIEAVVGLGGMGIVFKAFDPQLQRNVAIKVLSPHHASSPEARMRFAREGQATAAVVHQNVIAIHGVYEASQLPYIVMPFIQGESLQKRIDRTGGLNAVEIVDIAMQIAQGLAAAHQNGLVHRDIKPANILLDEVSRKVIITDFGLAHAVDDTRLTQSSMVAGTPQYMSPEQTLGEPIDGRSDLFSLGSVVYAMGTGQPPFRGETSLGVLRAIREIHPAPMHFKNAKLPTWLSSIVERLLAKRREDRFSDAGSLTHVLAQCLAHLESPKSPLPKELLPWASFKYRTWIHAKRHSRWIGILSIVGLTAWLGWLAIDQESNPKTADLKSLNTQNDDPPLKPITFNSSFEPGQGFNGWDRDTQDTLVVERPWTGTPEEEKRFGRNFVRIRGGTGIQQNQRASPYVWAQYVSIHARRQGGWGGFGMNFYDRDFGKVWQEKLELSAEALEELRGPGDGLVHYCLPVRIPKEAIYAQIWCHSSDVDGSITLDKFELFDAEQDLSSNRLEGIQKEFVANGMFRFYPEIQVTGYEFWEPVDQNSIQGIRRVAVENGEPHAGRLRLGQPARPTAIQQSLPLPSSREYRLEVQLAKEFPAGILHCNVTSYTSSGESNPIVDEVVPTNSTLWSVPFHSPQDSTKCILNFSVGPTEQAVEIQRVSVKLKVESGKWKVESGKWKNCGKEVE